MGRYPLILEGEIKGCATLPPPSARWDNHQTTHWTTAPFGSPVRLQKRPQACGGLLTVQPAGGDIQRQRFPGVGVENLVG